MTKIEQEFEQSIERALVKASQEHPKTEATLLTLKELLIIKGKEYRRNNNPYHNFNEGAKLLDVRSMQVLNFFRLKHVVSIGDISKDLEQGLKVSESQVNEKYNDILVYTLIELAYAENQKEASFQHYQSFETYLLAKHKMLKRL